MCSFGTFEGSVTIKANEFGLKRFWINSQLKDHLIIAAGTAPASASASASASAILVPVGWLCSA